MRLDFNTIGVDFGDDGSKHPVVDSVAHDGQNGPHHGRRDAALLVVVEAVENLPQHYRNIKNLI